MSESEPAGSRPAAADGSERAVADGASVVRALLPTFLFTDIAGSSRRWEMRPDAMDRALARHDRIVPPVIADHDGTVIKHTGDGFSAVFGDPTSAVAAAVEIQRRLAAEDFEDVGGLRVRAGIHRGPATPRDGDWFGSTVNRAARLMDAAAGGQILVSHDAARAVDDDRLGQVTLVDLGEHVLPDLGSERIHQANAVGLPHAFPPLRSLASMATNLPVQLTSFVGRHREMARTISLLDTARLVTVTGVGGGGKTRLALQAAGELLGDYPDGVFVAELAPIQDPLAVPRVVAKAVGHFDPIVEAVADDPAEAARATTRHLVDALARESRLVVVDNCEHLRDAVAELVETILRNCSSVRVLATSREPLGLPGEQRFEIPPLSIDASPPHDGEDGPVDRGDAFTLFVERAHEIRPDLAVEGRTATAVVGICRRLDGIPLGIELAAARVVSMSPTEIEARLNGAPEFLGDPRRQDRHTTLTSAIGWSYDLLEGDEQRLLRRMATFRGGCPLDGLEAVAAVEPAVPRPLRVVTRLVQKSLVRSHLLDGRTRYLLLEPVLQFAEARLQHSDEEGDVRRAHAAWTLDRFAAVASGAGMTGEVIAELRRDEDNLRRAHAWASEQDRDLATRLAVATGWWWHDRGDHATGLAWAKHAADHLRGTGSEEMLMAMAFHAWELEVTGRAEQATRVSEEWYEAAEHSGIPLAIGFAAQMLARLRALEGRLDETDALLERSLEQLRIAGDDVQLSWALTCREWTGLWRDDTPERARRAAHEILTLEDPGVGPRAMARCTIGMIELMEGDIESGVRILDDALTDVVGMVDRSYLLPFVARCELATGVLDAAAIEHLSEGLRLMRRTGHVSYLQFAIEAAAALTSDAETSATLFGAADALYRRLRTTPPGMYPEPIERARAALTERLGSERFGQLRRRGASMALEDALDLATAHLDARRARSERGNAPV